jgi:uncharacterized damage-inducible protein DinB
MNVTEDSRMSISASLLPEFDQEMATARAVLARVPADKFGYKPHEKSMSMGMLGGHIAEMPGWVVPTLGQDSLDISGYAPANPSSPAEVLANFDKNVAAARAALAAAGGDAFFKNWSLKHGDKTLMTMPKIAVIRTFVLSHVIHHRGQLSVYLRLNDIPVPSIYGPSADEGSMG